MGGVVLQDAAARARAAGFDDVELQCSLHNPLHKLLSKSPLPVPQDAAARARAAGFDGVELYGGDGYLVHQFLESHSNLRADSYGGSVANRCRFALETIDELVRCC